MTQPIGGILLAAGRSRRFGGDKRQAQLNNDTTLLQASINQAAAALDTLVVVLRGDDDELKAQLESATEHLPTRPRFCLSANSHLGMAHSLGDAMAEAASWQAALVSLGDMPHISAATFNELLNAYRKAIADDPSRAPIIVPVHAGKQGHPVLFDKAYFGEMAELQGDKGARPVIDAHPDQVTLLALDDAGILKDVDTPADL